VTISRKPRLLFIVTEDWFFRSHFLPMARAARDGGFDVHVLTRVRNDGEAIIRESLKLHALDADRGSLNPLRVLAQFDALTRRIRAIAPDIVHLIALRSVLLGGLAARRAGVGRRVLAVTGLGYSGTSPGPAARLIRAASRETMRRLLRTPGDRYLFENRSDPAALGFDPEDRSRVTIIGGAGVDPDIFHPAPLPPLAPLRLALVSRMLWSKGIDTAVDAVRIARERGADITLSLYGAPDPGNPKSVPGQSLQGWHGTNGTTWHGAAKAADIPAIWAAHHAAILPSRGGEGLPRSLLEAAACGRALLTTRVPGCEDMAGGGSGIAVQPDDPEALAEAIMRLAAAPESLAAMGQAARTKVLAHHTEERIGASVLALYRDLLGR
jgi:glycosyltransferase involved in cell wall biosynthesis